VTTRRDATASGAGRFEESIQLEDGRNFVLRPLRPDDLEALRRAFLRLTPEEIEYRFFYRSRELPASV
jgi:acetyltransferase